MNESGNTRNEIEYMMTCNMDNLFAKLATEVEKRELYSKRGLVVRGKEIFNSFQEELRGRVCPVYLAQGQQEKNYINLVSLVLGSIEGVPDLQGIPLVPLAVLIVRMGIEKFCAGYGEEEHI